MRKKAILSLLLLLCLPTILNAQRQNYRQIWKSWNEYQQYIYLWGFKDGAGSSFTVATNAAVPELMAPDGTQFSASLLEFLERFGKARNALLWGIELEVLAEVILSLYENPANSYIPFSDMVSIAQDKLRGRPVEERLIKAREGAELVRRALEQEGEKP